ncbi:MAG TPA: RES domain-containing protein [Solirubrobacterales bacterium]|nr:RES domain-containing protein [Solirubrobacterales bacterium]
MKLWRTLPFDRRAGAGESGGPLWFPREAQGYGRHDNPDLYGCLYAAEGAVSAVAEPLAAFRGTGALSASMLTHLGRPLALAELALPDDAIVVDLDDPAVLTAAGLRPSRVATRTRTVTQEIATELYRAHGDAVGLRWWSTLESSWINWTLFDRAAGVIGLTEVHELRIDDIVVRDAALFLGLS